MGNYSYNDNYSERLQQLNEEQLKLEKYLLDNSASINQDEMKEIQNELIGIRSEAQEISQFMSGGFY